MAFSPSFSSLMSLSHLNCFNLCSYFSFSIGERKTEPFLFAYIFILILKFLYHFASNLMRPKAKLHHCLLHLNKGFEKRTRPEEKQRRLHFPKPDALILPLCLNGSSQKLLRALFAKQFLPLSWKPLLLSALFLSLRTNMRGRGEKRDELFFKLYCV